MSEINISGSLAENGKWCTKTAKPQLRPVAGELRGILMPETNKLQQAPQAYVISLERDVLGVLPCRTSFPITCGRLRPGGLWASGLDHWPARGLIRGCTHWIGRLLGCPWV